MTKINFIGIILGIIISLTGCKHNSSNTLVIGTIAGPETQLAQVAAQVAWQRYGISLKIVEFNDYNLPNEALADDSLDANIYQHQAYLDAASAVHHYKFSVLGKTFIYPTGIYSIKFQKLAQLPLHAIVAIPNDPSNELRALLLLQQANLIKLNNTKTASLHDIISNPKQLRLKSLDAAQLSRVLSDVDAAIINTNFAITAGLNPLRDTLLLENKDSPYANLIVIREDSTKKAQLALVVKAFNSKEVAIKARELFGEHAISAWPE